ncbi:MAG: hypothetical protein LBE23_05860 [Vagococcus sp.]|jgi:hypothetical protein|nr:hypothetical protein [Vagococcus sp.]
MDKKLISFSVNEMNNTPSLEEINDSQFMKIRIRVFSDGITRHGYGFKLDDVKTSAFTLLGKPILYKYDVWNDDCSSHEKEEVQCGFIPKDEKDADITFEYDEDLNKTFICVSAYIWKVYQEKLVKILERDNGYKRVSCEMWVIESDEDKKSELGYVPVYKFCFNGLTLLGDSVTEACEGSDMQVVKFSIDAYEKAKEVFIQQLHNSINQESDKGSFLIQKNSGSKEETMAKPLENSATETPEVLENGQKRTTVNVSVSEYTDNYDDNGNYMGGTDEYHSKSETKIEKTDDNTPEVLENADKEKDTDNEGLENACDKVENSTETAEEKCCALEVKCAALESELSELKNSFSALELKCSSLEEYKTNKKNEEKTIAIECALNDVVDVLSSEEISTWRKKSLTCATVDGFKNELKAFAYDKQKQTGSNPVETLRNSIPNVIVEEPTNIWDRLAKTI